MSRRLPPPRDLMKMVVKERRCKFTLLYPATARVQKIKVPEHPTEKRCDYIFVEKDKQVLYVELKGSDFDSAVKQLRRTLVQLPQPVPTKLCVIVHHHCPVPAATVNDARKTFRKLGHELIVEKTPYEHPL